MSSIKELQAIVLAAGRSTRFKTEKTKLAEKICGREMILYITRLLEHMHVPTTAVVGYQRELIKKIIRKLHGDRIEFVVQERQQGTGHALFSAQQSFKNKNILIINGDMPLVTEEIIEQLYKKHKETDATISFVIAHNADPATGAYGRIIYKDQFIEIVEATDFQGDVHEHCFINAGIYIVKKQFLEEHICTLKANNTSNEFYITDLVKIASEKGYTVSTTSAPFDRIRGINTFRELWVAEQIKRAEIIKYWMERGVRFSLAQSIHIDWNVSIGPGTLIDCSVHLLGGTKIGKNCIIQGFSTLSNAQIGDNTNVYPHSIICDSSVGNNAKIGPFACIQEHSNVGDNTIIGNFVEIRKSEVGENSSAKHLTYLADAKIGSNVTIGAGTITCNHDGKQYQETTIEDNAFIGANNSIVAPVIIEKNTFTAAGAVITDKVPANSCAVRRPEQNVNGKMPDKDNNAPRETEDDNSNQSISVKKCKSIRQNRHTV